MRVNKNAVGKDKISEYVQMIKPTGQRAVLIKLLKMSDVHTGTAIHELMRRDGGNVFGL